MINVLRKKNLKNQKGFNLANFYWKTKATTKGHGNTKQEDQGPIRMANELNFINKKNIKFPHWLPTCNKSIVGMGGRSWKGVSSKVAKPIATSWVKMEDVCIFWRVMEIIWPKKKKPKQKWIAFKPFHTPSYIAIVMYKDFYLLVQTIKNLDCPKEELILWVPIIILFFLRVLLLSQWNLE